LTETNLWKEWAAAVGYDPNPAPVTPPSPVLHIGAGGGYAEAALNGEVARVLHSAPGDRNNSVNKAAFALGQAVAGGWLDEADVVSRLTEAALRVGQTPEETRKTIASGLRRGKENPRPLPTSQASRTAPINEDDDVQETLAELAQAMLAELKTTYDLDSLPMPQPLIEGVLYLDSTAWLVGDANAGKSLFALDMANCIGAGIPWKGREVEQGKVLYVVAEGVAGIKQRVRAWEAENNQRTAEVHYLPRPVQVLNRLEWATLREVAKQLRPSLIVIDTQAQCSVGLDENSPKEMNEFVAMVDTLRQVTGACVLSVHHTGKSGDIRGSTVMRGQATTVLKCSIDGELITLSGERKDGGKQKDGPAFPATNFVLKEHKLGMSARGREITSVTVELDTF
jgi:hypothetical protein